VFTYTVTFYCSICLQKLPLHRFIKLIIRLFFYMGNKFDLTSSEKGRIVELLAKASPTNEISTGGP